MISFLRHLRDPTRVSRIENRVPRIRENYHLVARVRENRVPTGPYRVLSIFLKKTVLSIRRLNLEAAKAHESLRTTVLVHDRGVQVFE